MAQSRELWQRFENGSADELQSFFGEAVSGKPIRVVLGPDWPSQTVPRFDLLRPEVDFRFFSVRGNDFGDRGLVSATETPTLRFTHGVVLDHCGISDEGIQAFLESRCAAGIEQLTLCNGVGVRTGARNSITDATAQFIARGSWLEKLTRLDFRKTDISFAGLEALLRSTRLPNLQSLHSHANPLSKAEFETLKATAEERKRLLPASPRVALYTEQNRPIISEW